LEQTASSNFNAVSSKTLEVYFNYSQSAASCRSTKQARKLLIKGWCGAVPMLSATKNGKIHNSWLAGPKDRGVNSETKQNAHGQAGLLSPQK